MLKLTHVADYPFLTQNCEGSKGIPYNNRNYLPEVPGVYILTDEEGLYIGQSKSLKGRHLNRSHEKYPLFERYGAYWVYWEALSTSEEAVAREREVLRQINTPLNMQGFVQTVPELPDLDDPLEAATLLLDLKSAEKRATLTVNRGREKFYDLLITRIREDKDQKVTIAGVGTISLQNTTKEEMDPEATAMVKALEKKHKTELASLKRSLGDRIKVFREPSLRIAPK